MATADPEVATGTHVRAHVRVFQRMTGRNRRAGILQLLVRVVRAALRPAQLAELLAEAVEEEFVAPADDGKQLPVCVLNYAQQK